MRSKPTVCTAAREGGRKESRNRSNATVTREQQQDVAFRKNSINLENCRIVKSVSQQRSASAAEANGLQRAKQMTSLSLLSPLRRVKCVGLGGMV